jgi:hypothetical protein
MALVQIKKNPSRRDLLVFVSLLPAVFGVLGVMRWRTGSTEAAQVLWGTGLACAATCFLVPSARRWLYVGWMYATYPIAWTVSHLILAVAYFLVATPVAILLRVLGRDPMQRKFDKAARSYWVVRQPNASVSRYFRQF